MTSLMTIVRGVGVGDGDVEDAEDAKDAEETDEADESEEAEEELPIVLPVELITSFSAKTIVGFII